MRLDPAGLGALATARRGRVVAFDAHRGLGELVEEHGGRFAFHAVAISDGTRSIPPGAAVLFCLVASPVGTLEAADLVALGGPSEAG